MESIAHRAAVVAACACLGLVALGTASASAYTNSYCGVLKTAYSWCGDGSNHSYNYNSATYAGAGDVWLCERLLIADSTTQRATPSCAYNAVDESFASFPQLTEAEIQHQTGSQHTIYGYATA
ncbi:MAG TPA: hypothetical protein VK501_27275 [Baekduia sp.]|uniref:hypothetical protein n=1 Tax=Baekduia sp. TaxID=2600305 RepID=UPI002CF9BDB2|nr:hypothetical protein [Baekduia sp.]HMJ37638.1 hypothetical protein [Baekduia sp.]